MIKTPPKKHLNPMTQVKLEIEKSIYKNLLSFHTLITNYQRNKIISLTIALKKNKILQINLAKEIKDLYTGNCKTLMNKIDEDTNKYKGIRCLWIISSCYSKQSIALFNPY